MERWRLCMGEDGQFLHLPGQGGVGDQPAVLMDAMRVIDAHRRIRK